MANVRQLPITVLIITNRARRELQPTLESLSWAAEVEVVAQPRLDDFARARNEVLDRGTQPWLFFVDGDEVVSTIDLDRLRQKLEEGETAGLAVRRVDVFHGQKLRFGEVGRVWLPRLFRRGRVHYERAVHEVPVVDGQVEPLERSVLELTHYSHPSISEFLQKVSRYAWLEATLRYQRGEQMSLFECLAYPVGKFWFNGVLKLGFLDGWRGLVYLSLMSLHSFFVRVYLYEIERTATPS